MRRLFLLSFLLIASTFASGQTAWDTGLDSSIRFYQTTDFGIVLAGTERSLYAIDCQTGERIWRRSTGKINETAVTPVPGTDLVLLSRDLGSDGIRLNAVTPGWIMTQRQLDLWVTPEAKAAQLNAQCLKELLYPPDIARMVLWLASDDSRMVTAQNFVVDGGRM